MIVLCLASLALAIASLPLDEPVLAYMAYPISLLAVLLARCDEQALNHGLKSWRDLDLIQCEIDVRQADVFRRATEAARREENDLRVEEDKRRAWSRAVMIGMSNAGRTAATQHRTRRATS